MTIQAKLKKFAFDTGYNYIIEQQKIRENFDKICFLLVGSVATGLCTVDSDVDICMLCDSETFDKISVDTKWQMGSPSEIIINGIQLHYYAISTESVIDKINKYDDIALYVYGTAAVIGGNSMIFDNIINLINSTNIKTSRFNMAIDMLNRRSKSLNQVLIIEDADPILYIKISLELVEHLLICIALKDNLQFEKRKRLYKTALLGETGKKLKDNIDSLLLLLSKLPNDATKKYANEFIELFTYCCECLL